MRAAKSRDSHNVVVLFVRVKSHKKLLGEMIMPITKQELWKAQLENFPNSVELSLADMLRWAVAHDDQQRALHVLTRALDGVGCDPHVFYRTQPEGGFMGVRYGVEGHAYISGFN